MVSFSETAREIIAEERASGRPRGREEYAKATGLTLPSPDADVVETELITMAGAVSAWRKSLSREREIPRLTTGYGRVDRATKGVQPGELFGILARTGSGKTLIADEIVSSWIRQRPASAFIAANLELPCEQLIARMMRKHFRRPEEAIETQALADDLDVKKLTQTYQNLYFIDRGLSRSRVGVSDAIAAKCISNHRNPLSGYRASAVLGLVGRTAA